MQKKMVSLLAVVAFSGVYTLTSTAADSRTSNPGMITVTPHSTPGAPGGQSAPGATVPGGTDPTQNVHPAPPPPPGGNAAPGGVVTSPGV